MIRPRIDRCFDRYRRTGDPRLLARVFDHAAPELWRIAAHLCRDRHDAEDALQSTFLAAIESKDTWDEQRPLLPWLVGMLVNRVREQRRQRARVVDAARLPARAAEDPAAAVGERELGVAFATALRAVTEPFRAVVEQHLVHGRSANEIAEALGVPAATVRTRLHRGIEQLRRRLPAGAAFAAAVPMHLPAAAFAATRRTVLAKVPGGAGVAAGSAGAVALFGWLATKQVVLAVAACALGAVAWWQTSAPSLPRTNAPDAAGAAIVAQQSDANECTPRGGVGAATATAAAPTASGREAVAPADEAGTLSVLVRNGATKVPLANVQVRAMRDVRRPHSHSNEVSPATHEAPSAASADSVPDSADGVTDAEGRVLLRLAAGPARVAVVSGLPESRPVTVLPATTTEYVHDVAPVFTADVLVVDPNGAPVPDATVLVQGQRDAAVKPIARTDATGRWREPRTDVQLMIRAVRHGFRASPATVVSSTSGPVVLELGSDPGSLHGIVMDAAGAPVPAAVVVLVADSAVGDSRVPITVRADERGRYRCDWLARGNHQILVNDQRDPRDRRVMMTQAIAGDEDAPPTDLRFPEGATLIVQLWRHDGDPACNQSVLLTNKASDPPVAFAPYLHFGGTTDANGAFTFRGVNPGRYMLAANFYFATVRRELELRTGERARFEHTFAALTTLQVEVVDERDRPRAGVHVDLQRDATEQIQLTTDEKGRVRFDELARGNHEVTVAADGKPLAQVRRTVSTDQPNRIVLRSDEALGRIIGRLHMAGGELPKNLTVKLGRVDARSTLREEAADVRVDAATGEIACDDLAAGSYLLAAMTMEPYCLLAQRAIEVKAPGVTDLGTIELGSGELKIDVRPSAGNPGRVHLAVMLPGMDLFAGEPPATNRQTPPLKKQLPPGSYQVMVWGPDILPSFADATIAIGASTPLTVDVEPGVRTEVRLPGSIGVMAVHLPDGTVLREMVLELRSWVRGLAPGEHRVEYTDFAGARYTATFAVTAQPGPPIELQLTDAK